MAIENKSNLTGYIISIAIAILLGVILVAIIADDTVSSTALTSVTDTVDISSLRSEFIINASLGPLNATDILSQPASASAWKTLDTTCAISAIRLYNQTGDLMTLTTDYTWTTDGNGNIGNLTLENIPDLNSSASNITTITYDYCPNDYITESWQRTVLNMVPGFFALGILIGAAFVILHILKKEGITGD